MTVIKSNHCAYEVHYHLVFPLKYRKAILSKQIEMELLRIGKEIEQRYELTIEQMGADLNHIHLLCSFHPKYSIGEMVRKYKSITAKELFITHPEIKKDLWGGEFWSDGYYAATVGEKGNWKAVEKYIKNQGIRPEDVQLHLFGMFP